MIFWIQLFVLGSSSHYLCYVFGSSGCYGFARAFQHLERKGKLRLARFSNTRDLVPLIPIHGMDRMGRSYRHVGMHIRLRKYKDQYQVYFCTVFHLTHMDA